MAEPKTQPRETDPADFLATVEPARKREEARQLDELFRRVTGHETGEGVSITLAQFAEYWKSEIEPFDRQERFYRLCKQPGSDGIVCGDFYPFINELLLYHPGLEFLESTPEFQEKYARTVVARIFYCVNSAGTGRHGREPKTRRGKG